jgi:Spy/CpxP family protein refolding chaperone
MTNRMKTSLAAGLVALTVAAMAPLAMAQDEQMRRRGPGPGVGGPPPGGPGGGPGMRAGGPMLPLRGLDLTEAQQGQVKSIVDSHQAEIRAAGEKIGAARQAMRALLEADQIDESAIRAKSVEVAAAEADAAIIQARVRQEVFGILTAEQLQKAKENGPRKRRGQR